MNPEKVSAGGGGGGDVCGGLCCESGFLPALVLMANPPPTSLLLSPLPPACTPTRTRTQMRTTYGKLMYLLMDSCDAEIEELLDFK